ncbi:MAG: ABC transporter permease [Vicinamibacterales bacterium]
MLRGLLHLTWLEIKIFVREPLGVVGTVGMPVLLFVLVGRFFARAPRRGGPGLPAGLAGDLPIFASLFVAIGAVLSLVAIMAIYRESGILKRLRATPLRPHTILAAHVLTKLVFSAITVGLMLLAGRAYFAAGMAASWLSFGVAVLFTTLSVSAVGFVIASLVPTARFAQPLGALVLYPMLGLSGLFVPLDALPPTLAALGRLLPLTYAVSLLRGIWMGEGWLAHGGDVAALVLTFVVATALSSRLFRWE